MAHIDDLDDAPKSTQSIGAPDAKPYLDLESWQGNGPKTHM